MLRSSLLLVRQTRWGCRYYLRKRPLPVDSSPQIDWPSRIGKSLAFTIGTTALFFTGSSLIQYENRRAAARKETRNPVTAWYDQFPEVKLFKALTPGKKLFCGILAINGIVFAMWQIPRLSPLMRKYFVVFPSSNMLSPMLLSAFSQDKALPLLVNMAVLLSFIDPAVNLMGVPHFLALYLSGGVIASQASILGTLFTKQWSGSFGALGAIYAVAAVVCMKYPDSHMCIIFLPIFSFPAIIGLKSLAAFDTIGLLSRRSPFDHAGHLGALLFGVGYYLGGNKLYVMYDRALLQYWHRIRSSRKN